MCAILDISITVTPYLDEVGSLLPTEKWSRDVGQLTAREIIPGSVTEDHWPAVENLRQGYLEFGIVLNCLSALRYLYS
jgi:sulfur relay (sulfurtransferase) DsrC/TusE family protein